MSSDDEMDTLRQAVFKRFENHTTYKDLSDEFGISERRIRLAYQSMKCLDSQMQSHHDVRLEILPRGRPTKMPTRHEEAIAEAIRYFAENNTPLPREGVKDLVEHYISMLSEEEQDTIHFTGNRPSTTWVKKFSNRNKLSYRRVQQVEAVRVQAVSRSNVSEHIARVQAAINRYSIRSASQIINMDQSGMSFEKIVGRSLRKGFCDAATRKCSLAVQKTLQTKGNLNRVTVMPVVSASGTAYKPVIVYPGKLPHFRTVNGKHETLYDSLPDCYIYYKETAAANSEIILDWAEKFLIETESIRSEGKHLLLILDGYSGHLQYKFLNLMKKNRVVVIALPSHTSHVLQPLDVTVFGPYKNYLQHELHRLARITVKINAFTVAKCIANAYSKAFNSSNIISGFVKCGIWNELTRSTDVSALESLFVDTSTSALPLSVVIETFRNKERTLLRDVNVEEEGRIRIDTSSGAHVTAEVVLDALQKRKERQAAALSKLDTSEAELKDKSEGKKALERYAKLADRRIEQRKRLRESRNLRRAKRRNLVENMANL